MKRGTMIKNKKHRFRRFFFWFLGLNLLLVLLVAFAGMLFIRHRLKTLPVIDAQYLKTYETSKILDKSGNIIWQPTDRRVTVLEYGEIPEFYKTALIAVEDEGFWNSKGVSVKGVANMVIGVLRSKVDKSYIPRGGSTIEQQLIKNKFYDGGLGYDTTTRKIQELFLAIQLDENFTKEEILAFYVNDLEFAEGAFGLGSIMRTYFGKTPDDYKERSIETIAELSYLAGLGKAPSRYNLYENPDLAKERKDTVLGVLLEKELITETEYQGALAFDLGTNLKPRGWEVKEARASNLRFKTYTDGVLQELSDLGYDLKEASLTVQTFLDPEQYETVENLVRTDDYYLDENEQAAVAVMDTNGVVVALVGSRYPEDEFNRALSKNRSSGSSMKPFTAYAPLLQYFGSSYTTGSRFDTSDYPYPGSEAVMHNFGGSQNGMQTMWDCLKHSYNTPVGRIDDKILGSARMRLFLQGLGLAEKETYSSVDGIGLFISPLQSAAAYNALSCGGVYTRPRFIDTITFSDGSVRKIEPKQTQAMKESTAWVITQILRDIPGNTAKKAAIPEYEGYAGKTGSVKFADSVDAPAPYGDGGSDVWFCSYTKDGYAISVWCGYDAPNTSPRIPDTYRGQQEINRDLQRLLNGDREIPNWEKPETVTKLGEQNYQVTDSEDPFADPSKWADVSAYPSLTVSELLPGDDVSDNWQEEESGFWFSYWKEHGLDIPKVIDDSLYQELIE